MSVSLVPSPPSQRLALRSGAVAAPCRRAQAAGTVPCLPVCRERNSATDCLHVSQGFVLLRTAGRWDVGNSACTWELQLASVRAVLVLSSAAGAERAGAAGTGEGARRGFGGEGAAPGPARGAACAPWDHAGLRWSGIGAQT